MEIIQKFLRYCFVFLVLFVLQSAGLCTWFEAQANLVLILFLFIGMHKGRHGENPLPIMLALSMFAISFSLLFAQAAFLPLLITVCIGCGSYELRKILTGDKFSDFLILISISTLLFHGLLFGIHSFAHEGLLTTSYFLDTLCMIGKELILNTVLGLIAWFFYERVKKR